MSIKYSCAIKHIKRIYSLFLSESYASEKMPTEKHQKKVSVFSFHHKAEKGENCVFVLTFAAADKNTLKLFGTIHKTLKY